MEILKTINNSGRIFEILLVLLITIVLLKYLGLISNKLSKIFKIDKGYMKYVSFVLRFIILLTSAILILNLLGLSSVVTASLAGLGIFSLSLGFSMQEVGANLISGLLILLSKPFEPGSIIEVDGYVGVVESITLRAVELKTFSNEKVMIPNKTIILSPIIDYSSPSYRRIDLDVGVAYDTNLEKLEKVSLEIMESIGFDSGDNENDIVYVNFGDSSIQLMFRYWIDSAKHDIFIAKSELIKQIVLQYKKAGIEIPYPVRTIVNRKGK